jgi:drug/metabolite transporter (DMT)-like permease
LFSSLLFFFRKGTVLCAHIRQKEFLHGMSLHPAVVTIGRSRSVMLVALVVGAAAVTQVLATQLTSLVFRESSFSSPVSLTWFSMHGLLVMALPWLWEEWTSGRLCNSRRGAVVAPVMSRSQTTPDQSMPVFASLPQRCEDVGNDSTAISPRTAHNAAAHEAQDNNKDHRPGGKTSSPLLPSVSHLQPFEAALTQRHPFFASLHGVSRILFLYALYIAANVSYVKALQGMAPALVSAIFCAAPGFVLLLSWPVLGRQIQRVEVASVLLGLGGILLITQPWHASAPSGQPAPSSGGLNTLYATISPAASAVYKVFFSKFYSDASWKYVGSRLGALAIVNIILGTFLLSVYLSVGGEHDPTVTSQDGGSGIPWRWILPANAASISFNYLVNFGVTITFPLFVSVASLVSTAANLILDATVVNSSTSPGGVGAVEIAGLLMVLSSLVILLVSVWLQRRRQALLFVDALQPDETR